MAQLDPEQATYLTSGPVLSAEFNGIENCHCDDGFTFEGKLACALASDKLRGESFHCLVGGSAVPPVLNLAKHLRELEAIPGRQIVIFTRADWP